MQPGWRGTWILALGWIGLLLIGWPLSAVPPLATNVALVGSWPPYVTGRATDAQLVNDHLYVSLAEGGLQIWNVRDPQKPAVLWSIRFPGVGPVGIVGRHVYVGGKEMHILEVADPTRPSYRGAWAHGDVRTLVIAAMTDPPLGYAVGSRGLLTLDLSNPSTPVPIWTNDLSVGEAEVPRLVLDGDYALVVHGLNVRILDIRDPRRPRLVMTFVGLSDWGGFHDIAIRGDVAYLGGSTELHLLDLRERERPSRLGSVPLYGLFAALRPRLVLHGDHLYVGMQGFLSRFDISEPGTPVALPRLTLGLADDSLVGMGDPGVHAMSLGSAGQLVMARGHDGVDIMSLADPAEPRSIGKVATYLDVRGVKLSGNQALLFSYPVGIQILDVATPGRPSPGRTEFFPHTQLKYQPFETVGSRVYALGSGGELHTLDFSDLSSPPLRRVGTIASPAPASLAVSEPHAVVTSYEYFSQKTYLRRAYNLEEVSLMAVSSSVGWNGVLSCSPVSTPPRSLAPGGVDWIRNQRLYHLEGELTVSQLLPESGVPQPPHWRLPIEGCFRFVSSTGHRDYVGGEGIAVLNTGQPDAPVYLGRIWTNRIYGLSAEGRYVVFTDGEGLKVLDALDPQQPRLIGSYQTSNMREVLKAGRYAFVARGQDGLLTLDLGEPFAMSPRITRDLRSARVPRGGRMRFDFGVVGSTPLTFYWFRNGKIIPGETNAFLDLPSVTGPLSGFIMAAARNANGNALSSVISLTINEEPFARVERILEVGDVFAPRTLVRVQVQAQDDRFVTRLVVRLDGSVVASLPIDPPAQECQRVVDVFLRTPGTHQLTVDSFDDEGAYALSDPFPVHVVDKPTFYFTEPHVVANEAAQGVYLVVRRVNSSNQPASVHLATADQTARAVSDRGPGHYLALSKTLHFAPEQVSQSVLINFVDNGVYQDDRYFAVRLSQPSAGWGIQPPAEARVTIQDDDSADQRELWSETVGPAPAPAARGSLQIRLEPPQAVGKWRFRWETRWRDSAETVHGLVPGNYETVFLPRTGYLSPEDTVITIAPGVSETMTEHYVPVDAESGGLSMTLWPAAVVDWFVPAQWRLQGSATGTWLHSGVILTNLPVGTHLVEFKVIPGYLAPAPQHVEVVPNQIVVRKARYTLPTAAPGEPLQRVRDFESFRTGLSEALPYAFNGQLLTDAGYASGCVVRPRTVLTAAHAVFSGGSLSYVNRVWWFFQRHRGEHEPVPLQARGFYVFAGYAAARTNDVLNTGLDPGESSAASLGLDVAAIYFYQDAGRGGYGGFTVWSSAEAWLEDPALRLALSYPVENIPEGDVGRLHQLGPERFYFATAGGPLLYSPSLRVQPGSSGGPLYSKGVNALGQPLYLPSAVQLGGSDRMIVRLIDLDVADLILRSETSSVGGGIGTGGGVIHVTASGAEIARRAGLLSVRVGPPAAVRLGGAWRVSPTNYGELGELAGYTNFTSGSESLPVLSAQFALEVRPLEGFTLPSNKVARVVEDANVLLDLRYSVLPPRWVTDPLRGLGMVGTPRTTYRVEGQLGSMAESDWAALHRITLEPGTNWLPGISTTEATGRIHRAVWLSE